MDIKQLSTDPRVTVRRSGQPFHDGTAVVYWMQRAQRATDNPAVRRELLELISDYGRGLLPLVAQLTLARRCVRQFGVAYLQAKTYLEPHPKELMLRSHV